LIDHISQITEGNLDIEEFKAKSSQDEIGRLAKVFNQMHATIKRQIQELNKHRDLLEVEVKERTYELEQANRKLDIISRTDELTQLPNRRDMHRTIEKEVDRANRFKKAFSIIFIDIDHFKDVNDTYGHAAGDAVLKSVASTIRSLLRKYDVLARYGGEEFLTLLPETELKDAAHVAERFRKQIENQTIFFGGQEIKVTITLGVAQFDSGLGAERCIQLADKALYEGKEHDRNRVILWTDDQAVESTDKPLA
jgi:diguanylate cyclase (GGDEF)-like protein